MSESNESKSTPSQSSGASRSWQSRISGPGTIFLVQGFDSTRRKAWYYVRVARTKVSAFERIGGCQSINLNKFGEILMSGYGERPPEEVLMRAKADFGFEEAS